MQTHESKTMTSDNARLYVAYQAARSTVPAPTAPDPAVYWATDAESSDIGRNVEFERIRTMQSGRDESLPSKSTITAPQSITTLIDKRHFGMFLGALLGPAVSTTAKASGFVMFRENPSADQTIDINGSVVTFKAAGAAGLQVNIGASLTATVTALAAMLGASTDANLSASDYAANGHRLIVTAKAAGVAGNAVTLGSGTAPAYVSSDTLKGGGLRQHVFESGKTGLPLLSLVTDQTDMAAGGPRYKAVVDTRFAGMQLAIQKNGAARVTFTAVGVNERTLDADPVADHTVAAEIDRFSNLQGGILINDECICGVVESGQISYDNGLITDATMCCPGDPDAGGISDANPGPSTAGVTMNARYYDPLITGKAEAGDSVALLYQFYDASDGASLSFIFDQVTLPETTRGYNAGAAVVQNFNGIASKSQASPSMRVVLVNDIASY